VTGGKEFFERGGEIVAGLLRIAKLDQRVALIVVYR
jgi:hypothetical protein